jgi:hypothetical protein
LVRVRSIKILGDQERGQPFSDDDGFIHRARRTLVQHRHAVGRALEIADQQTNLRQDPLVAILGQQRATGVFVPDEQCFEVAGHAGAVAGFGMAHGVEQQVGDFRHGGDDDHHWPVLLFRSGQRCRYAHAVRRAYAGAAELHDQQVVQLKSFPLVTRARTILRIASST